MGFYLYKVKSTTDGNRQFSDPESLRLAGKNGPIGKFVQSRITSSTSAPFTWHLNSRDLLSLVGVPEKELSNRAIVIDLKPKEKTVELYLLHNIWGHTENDWTPLALQLEELSTNVKRVTDSAPPRFIAYGHLDVPIIEFLYLRGGLKFHNWGWGPVGSVNGALLWPQALRYFLSVIPKQAVGGA